MTRLGLLLLLAGFLLVPSVSAQTTEPCVPGVAEHRVDLVDTGAGLDARESLTYDFSGTARTGDHANVTVGLARDALDVTGTLDYQNGSTFEIPADALTVAGGDTSEPFVSFSTMDVTDQPAPDAFRVELAYRLEGSDVFSKTTACAAASLVVFATPATGSDATGPNLGDFVATGDGRLHATPGAVGAGFPVVVTFVEGDAPPPPIEDLTQYVWGAAGLLVGLFLMYVVIKQGWVRIRREKKFEKGGRMEGAAMLEARRRTLMAALKELETAHEADEVADEAYSPLKEEYKAQAVRVLRSLEARKEPADKE